MQTETNSPGDDCHTKPSHESVTVLIVVGVTNVYIGTGSSRANRNYVILGRGGQLGKMTQATGKLKALACWLHDTQQNDILHNNGR